MRILTCYLPATEGTARVAGFDVFEQPLEVKRRVGYTAGDAAPLPRHGGRRRSWTSAPRSRASPKATRAARIDEAVGKARVGDVRANPDRRSSPRATASASASPRPSSHNPEVLILDEPTAGLDPKQIIETRELIRGLGGDHTIILSTHILPEVSMTCGRVVIINKGRVVAEDTPDNLTHRLRGAATLRVEVRGDAAAVEAALRAVPGVLAVHAPARPASPLEVEAEAGRDVRAERGPRGGRRRGMDLVGLQQVGMSLEEIFLHLTTTDAADRGSARPRAPEVRHDRAPQRGRHRREGVAALLRQPHRLGGALRVDAAVRHLLLLPRLQLLPRALHAHRPADGVRRRAQDVAQRVGDPPASCTTWRWWRSSWRPC